MNRQEALAQYHQDKNLWGADLQYADLRNVNLWNADLRNANLRNANLRNANLWNANLRYADLRNADLRYANLWNANLQCADLRGANLRDVDLRDTGLIYFQYERHLAYYCQGVLQIGCERHPLIYWLEHYQTIGRVYDYSPLQIEKYHQFMLLCQKEAAR